MAATSQQYTMVAGKDGKNPGSLKDLIFNFRQNFLTRNVEIVPGLTFNQYETVKRTYFYLHNQFESGPNDEQGNPKYFYDLITSRNDQATKNIDLDTKDCYIKAETPGAYLKSWLLRREFMAFAKESGFGLKLNQLSDDLPDFGTVVWKKVKNDEGETDVSFVELINLMNDPVVDCLEDGMVIERHLMTQAEMRGMEKWSQDKVQALIDSGKTVRKSQFMTTNPQVANQTFQAVDDQSSYYELYEMWGEIPKWMFENYKATGSTDGIAAAMKAAPSGEPTAPVAAVPHTNDSVYVMAIVSGVDEGATEQVMFIEEASRDKFPYKAVHFRRRKGRFLGMGNYELCFPLIEKMNEVTNRFFSSLRVALLHLYQTRDKQHVKNVLTDLLDGDVVVNRSELAAIPTEIRGYTQYVDEVNRIERQADKLCNSYEVVTGETMPSGTPFRLGAQQLSSATLLFKYIRQNEALFVEDVFNAWLLPGFAEKMTKAHILDLLEDQDDIEFYYSAVRKMIQYQTLKKYVLETSTLPDAGQLELVGALVKDQMTKGPKQVSIEENYYADQKYSVKMIIDGENDAKKEHLETLSNLFQVLAANPAALQEPRLMKIINMILEQSGYSPVEINSLNQTSTNPLLNPGNQGGGGVERSTLPQGQPAAAVAGAVK